jgi:hypothetical protein
MCECGERAVKIEVYRGAVLFRCVGCNVYRQGGEANE